MLRQLVKTAAAWGLHHSGIGRRNSPLVVGYHRTVAEFPTDPKSTIPALCISVKMLETQLDWIGQRYRFVSLDELQEHPEGTAAVTFDDGYQDFYEHAFPLLKRKGIPAAVFVVTDLVDTPQLQIHDQLYLLLAKSRTAEEAQKALEFLMANRPQTDLLRLIETLQAEGPIEEDVQRAHRSLTWNQIQEMRRNGIIIGSHTRTHAVLPNEDPGKVAIELVQAREELELRLGSPIRHFAYPCGQFDERTIQAVDHAGYKSAYTICEHRDVRYPQLTISRKLLWENSCLDARGLFSPSIMGCHAHGSFDLLAGCRMTHGGVLCSS